MLLKSHEVSQILIRMGIKKGDNIFLHVDAFVCAFLHGINFDDKINTLITGFTDLIGDEGTLVLPTFSYSATKNKVFDPVKTKSEVGVITDYFRIKDKVLRSNNPIFSVSATGKLSNEFKDSSITDCFGEGTCFDLIYKNNFWILTLGCSFDRITFIHFVEQYNNVSYRYFKNFKSKIYNDSKLNSSQIRYFVRDLNRDSDVSLDKLKESLISKELLKIDSINRASILAVRSEDFFNTANEMINTKENIHTKEGNYEI